MKRVVVATGNPHKVTEIQAALAIEGWEFIALAELGDFPEPVEDADAFEGNARIKARAAYEATGLPALADDSGLIVDALDGAPGVYSSRYAGEGCSARECNEKLLTALADVPSDRRTARFVSVLVMMDSDGSERVARGTCEGSIGFAPRGEEGFGYDPLFFPDAYDGKRTMAELTMDEKNAISHRGNALAAFKAQVLGI